MGTLLAVPVGMVNVDQGVQRPRVVAIRTSRYGECKTDDKGAFYQARGAPRIGA